MPLSVKLGAAQGKLVMFDAGVAFSVARKALSRPYTPPPFLAAPLIKSGLKSGIRRVDVPRLIACPV